MNKIDDEREVTAMDASETTRGRRRVSENREFRAMYVVCFVLFLMAATVSRLLPLRWRPWPPTDRHSRSIIGDARAATSAFLPFAMMG